MTDKEILDNINYYNIKVAEILDVEPMEIEAKLSNAKKLAGSCRITYKEVSATIRISRVLAQIRSKEETQNTIVHELCHAYNVVNDGHGYYWKQIAKEVGDALGFKITRTYGLSKAQEQQLQQLTEIKSPVGLIEVPELDYKKYIYRKSRGYRENYKGWYLVKNGRRYGVIFTRLS